jgi:hypothetical protein
MKSFRSTFVTPLAVTLLFAHGPAYAADPDPEAVKVATQILEATHASTLSEQMVAQMMKAFSATLNQANPGKSKDVEDILNQVVVPELHDSMPEVMAISANTYASNFSIDELKQILAFYQSDAGKIYIGKLPDVMRQNSVASQAFVQKLVLRVQEKTVKALQAKGLKVQ